MFSLVANMNRACTVYGFYHVSCMVFNCVTLVWYLILIIMF
jgi:hypothetical protein